jgi:NAD(P)-dependent dehydrogenase (short-subunit alcohol dehydrogenase family)
MDPFRDRVVLITGAGSGIGRQLALTLAGAGARIAGLDVQPEGLETLARDLAGKPFSSARADVTDRASVQAAVKTVEAALGPTDILIASAGIGRATPAATFSAEEVNAHIQVNLIGVVNSIDAVLPAMRERRTGHLVAISSLASYRGLPRMAGYCASKAGVNALMDALRVDLRPLGITCTTVCPGWIRTPMTAPLGLPPQIVLEVEEAARIIARGIENKKPFLAFPANMVRQCWLLRHLPRALSDWLTVRQLRRATWLKET